MMAGETTVYTMTKHFLEWRQVLGERGPACYRHSVSMGTINQRREWKGKQNGISISFLSKTFLPSYAKLKRISRFIKTGWSNVQKDVFFENTSKFWNDFE